MHHICLYSNLQGLGVTASSTTAADFAWSTNFTANPVLPSETSTAAISATDGANNTKTDLHLNHVNSPSSQTLTFDLNGNMISDGTNTYKWDAANRLIEIDYPGVGNFSSFNYGSLGERVKIVETRSNIVTSTEQFMFSGLQMCEKRDASGNLTKAYFSRGQTASGTVTKYFYELNHRSDICSVTDNSGNNLSLIVYEPWGQPSLLSGTLLADFGYAGMYQHPASGLNLTTYRPYFSKLARWLTRDPVGESAGSNLFAYVLNRPIIAIDPLGLDIYVTNGQKVPGAGGGDWHTQVCVDLWDACGKKKTGERRCFSYGLFPDGKGYFYEEPKENLKNPIWENKRKTTTYKQDVAALNRLINLRGTMGEKGAYDHIWNSHNIPSLLFNTLP